MRFTARHDELNDLLRLAAAPAGQTLLFTGEHGIGKSRLLVETAAVSPVRAVVLSCNPAESAWALSGLTTLFASIDDPRAIEFAGRFTLRTTEPQAMFAASRDLLTLLRGLDLHPLLLLIDDIDVMDLESQTLIGFMAGRLAGTQLRVAATATRVSEPNPLAGFTAMPLRPLTMEESAVLALSELGDGADVGTVQIIASRSGGIPRVIEQSVAALSHDQAIGREPLVLPMRPPDAIRAAALERLVGASPEAVELAEEIAMGPVHLLPVLTRRDIDRVDALESLVDTGLAELHGQFVRMREPLLRSYLYWHLDPHSRRERHRELGALYAGVDERIRIWHESFARITDPSSDQLVAAAIELARDGDSESAIELAERALLIDVDSARRHPVMLHFVDTLSAGGELDLADHYLRTVRPEHPEPALSLQLARTRIALEYERTQRVPVREVEASVSLHGDDDPGGAAALLSLVTDFHSAKWDVDGARAWLRIAGMFAAQGGSSAAQPAVTEAARMVDAVDGSPVDEPTGSRMSTDSLNALSAASLISFGTTLCYREHYAQARRVVNVVFHGHTAERLAIDWAWNLSFINEVRAGDFRRAHWVVDGWVAEGTGGSVRHHSARVLAQAWNALTLDRRDEAEERSKECSELASDERNPAVLARLYSFQGAHALLQHDIESAIRLLQLADATSAHIANLSLVRHAANLIEAYAAASRLREAEAVLRRMLEQQRTRPSHWLDRAVARSRAVLAPDQLAPELFTEAIAAYEGAGGVDGAYEKGRTLLAYSERLVRLGRRSEAEQASAEASAAFESAGALSWARRAAAREPGADAEPGSLLALLKDDEREVAEMVRRGLRNREIAGELYISLRTVELRLTHIYRKVGARSRSHLASLLA